MAPEIADVTKIQTGQAKTNRSRFGSRNAYVTVLAGAGDYVKGVVGLAKGLRKVAGSAYPLVVAVLPDVPEEHRRMLVSQGCIVRQIEPIYPPENQTRFAMAYYVINYSKLRIWGVKSNFLVLMKYIKAIIDKLIYINAAYFSLWSTTRWCT